MTSGEMIVDSMTIGCHVFSPRSRSFIHRHNYKHCSSHVIRGLTSVDVSSETRSLRSIKRDDYDELLYFSHFVNQSH